MTQLDYDNGITQTGGGYNHNLSGLPRNQNNLQENKIEWT